MSYAPPDQDDLDVRLARIVYGRVARRWCAADRSCGGWVVRYPGGVIGDRLWRPAAGHALLWCYVPDPRYPRDWQPVPAFGQDGGLMLAALEMYGDTWGRRITWRRAPSGRRHGVVHFVTIGGETAERPVVGCEGSTFALAARAAVLAMEGQHG